MKVTGYVVDFSKLGNTCQVAECIAQVLAGSGPVRVLELHGWSEIQPARGDPRVVGCPTHRLNLPDTVASVLAGWPRRFLWGVYLAVLDTSYRMSWWLRRFPAAPRLARRLRRLGGTHLVRPETLHVVGREGPLDVGELAHARAWAEVFLERWRRRIARA